MGNAISAPPTLSSLAGDLEKSQFYVEAELSGNRYCKSLKCIHTSNTVVAKVIAAPKVSPSASSSVEGTAFPSTDTGVLEYFTSYEKAMSAMRHSPLQRAHICHTSFVAMVRSGSAVLTSRPFAHATLNQRLSSNPHLGDLEKWFFTYQLLSALSSIHDAGYFHGDLKPSNVLLTSWGWLLLADYAPFKPFELPSDNTAFLSHFFEKDFDEQCYLAPSRFQNAASSPVDHEREGLAWGKPSKHVLSKIQKADLFAAGCIIAEIFEGGDHFLKLPDVLRMKSTIEHAESRLLKIQDATARRIVKNLVIDSQADGAMPSSSMVDSLVSQIPFIDVFPELEKRLFDFGQRDSAGQIKYLESEVATWISRFTSENDGKNCLILILNCILSILSGAAQAMTKIEALELLRTILPKLSLTQKLEKALPAICVCILDGSSALQAHAISMLADCMRVPSPSLCGAGASLNKCPKSLLETSLPFMNQVMSQSAHNGCEIVRCSLANSLGQIGQSTVQLISTVAENQSMLQRLESQFAACLASVCVHIFTTNRDASIVSLLANLPSILPLIGHTRTVEEVFPHIIPSLSSKNPVLRRELFRAIEGFASVLDESSFEVLLLPIFSHGVNEGDCLVIEAVISALCRCLDLTSHVQWVFQLLPQISQLLISSDATVRLSTVALCAKLSVVVGPVASRLQVWPVIKPFFQDDPIIFSEESIMQHLFPPLSKLALSLALEHPEEFTRLVQSQDDGNRAGPPFEDLDASDISKLKSLSEHVMNVIAARANAESSNNESDSLKLHSEEEWLQDEWNSFFGHLEDFQVQDDDDKLSPMVRSKSTGLAGTLPKAPKQPKSVREAEQSKRQSRKSVLPVGNSNDLGLCEPRAIASNRLTLSGWVPRGRFKAEGRGHAGPVVSIVPSIESSWFATVGADASVRVWDLNLLEHKIPNASVSHVGLGGVARTACAVEGTRSVAVGRDRNEIDIVRVEVIEGSSSSFSASTSSRSMRRPHALPKDVRSLRKLQVPFHGGVSCIRSAWQDGTVLLGGLMGSDALGVWDCRTNVCCATIPLPKGHGAVLDIAIEPELTWCCVGTARGKIALMDLRASLPVLEWQATEGPIFSLQTCPSWEPAAGSTVSSHRLVLANHGRNDVAVWDPATGKRFAQFSAADSTGFGAEEDSAAESIGGAALVDSVDETAGCQNDYGVMDLEQLASQSGGVKKIKLLPEGTSMIAAGADRLLRFWDFIRPEASKQVASQLDSNHWHYSFSARQEDDEREVLHYVESSASTLQAPSMPAAASLQQANVTLQSPQLGPSYKRLGGEMHDDCITQMEFMSFPQRLVTADRDGVVKLWE